VNLEAFCADYGRAIEGLKPWLERASQVKAAQREHYGYALEQLLMRRDDAVAEAERQHLDQLIGLIHATDARLMEASAAVRAALGVNVERFLSSPDSGHRKVAGRR
jgi:hypothetical protein